jgi:phage-related protein
MDLFDLAAKITLDTGDYEKKLAGAEKQGSGFADKLKNGLSTAAKVGGAAIAAIGTGAVALGKSFVSGVADVASYGDAIDKNSQKMGISAKAYQEWDFILQHSGSSIDAMNRGMMTLSKQAESNSDAFQKLGITQEDLANLNKEDLFAKTIEGLQALGEGTERDTIAAELFGGSAKELGPLLNTTADDVNAMRKQVNDLGGVMSNKAVKNAAAFQDSLQNLKTAIDGIKRSFLSDFLPAITQVSDGLTKLFSGDKLSGLEDIKNGVKALVDDLTSQLPEFLEIGWGIVESIVTAINDNLPMLLQKGADLLLNGVIPGIIDNLPMLVETAFQIIAQLVTSIGQALPELIPAAVSMVIQIVESLLDNIDLLIDAAIDLIMGLAEGLIKAVPILIEKAPEIIMKLVEAIIRNAPKLIKAGLELVVKLIAGIVQSFGKLFGAGEDVVNKIGEGIKNVWDNFKEWAGNIVSKIGEGIKNAWEKIKEFGSSIVNTIGDGIKSVWDNFKGWAGDIINRIKTGLEEGFQRIKDVGKNLVEGLWGGIKEKAKWLKDKVSGWASDLWGSVKKFFGVHSPSTKMAWIGEMLDKGLASGIDKYGNRAIDAARSVSDGILASMSGLSGSASFDANYASANVRRAFGGSSISALSGSGVINLYLDGDTLVGSTDKRMDRNLGQIQKLKSRYGGV